MRNSPFVRLALVGLIAGSSVVKAQDAVNAQCLVVDETLAGTATGDEQDGSENLETQLKTDMRLSGFEFCRNLSTQYLEFLELRVSANFGAEETQLGLSTLGQNLNDDTQQFCFPVTLTTFVTGIEAHFDPTDTFISGFKITVLSDSGESRSNSVGVTDSASPVTYNFSTDYPLIGMNGYSSGTQINAATFISYDLVTDCQNYVEPTPDPDPVVDDTTDDPVDDTTVDDTVVDDTTDDSTVVDPVDSDPVVDDTPADDGTDPTDSTDPTDDSTDPADDSTDTSDDTTDPADDSVVDDTDSGDGDSSSDATEPLTVVENDYNT